VPRPSGFETLIFKWLLKNEVWCCYETVAPLSAHTASGIKLLAGIRCNRNLNWKGSAALKAALTI
jgi:hypothetical protein